MYKEKEYKKKNDKKKYFKTCGVCGEKYPSSEMFKDKGSNTGWVCFDCYGCEHPQYFMDESVV